MSTLLPEIGFRSIRPLGGSQRDAFEEVGVQLFRGETNGIGVFYAIEGSGGDGGVEALRELPGGEKVGFQAKYFDRLAASQWSQITDSIRAAIRNHPTLVEYIVAVPLNRNPTQVTKWKSLVSQWQANARQQGIQNEIKFIWWGHTELIGLLTSDAYRNQLVYWFGVPEFSVGWLDSINQANIALLGKRYSPKQHVETFTGTSLEAFAWGENGKKRILADFLRVAEKWRTLDRRSLARAESAAEFIVLTKSLRTTMQDIMAFRWPKEGYPRISPFRELIQGALDTCNDLEWELHKMNHAEKEKSADPGKRNTNSWKIGPYDMLIHELRQLSEVLANLKQEAVICLSADASKLLIIGEAGSGKSHIIADLIVAARTRSQPGLLLLGEQFLGNGDPWTAATGILGWNHKPEDLLAALDQEGILAGRPALLCIDALNECDQRRLWHSHLIQFAERIDRYPHVKLLVSCRSDFVSITLPELIRPGASGAWPHIQHRGFGPEVVEAIEHYFEAFGVKAAYFPPVLAEFRNPLFLRVFCEAFEGQDLPTGPLSLDRVMRARVERLCQQIKKEIDCDPEDTRAALRAISKEIAENGGQPIPRETARARTAEHSPNKEASRSLYSRLLSNGMLVEAVRFPRTEIEEPEVIVRFPFERFSDYFIASQIITAAKSAEDFRSQFDPSQRLAHFRQSWDYYENRGVARALAILAPERLGLEFAEIIEDPANREMVLEDFLESLAWRSTDSISATSDKLRLEAGESGIDLLPTYLRLSTIPQHPFNSEFLGKQLMELPMPDRELAWTIPVSNLSVWGEGDILGELLDWCFRAPTRLIPDEQALLACRLLLWLCTSNHRALRTRSTIAAIRLLVGRPHIVEQLVSELNSVDDPYVTERLYAVAAGVAMRLPKGDGLSNLATKIHSMVFAQEHVTSNILTRDFASTVIEACLAKGCLPANIMPESFRPPYNSAWPAILSDEEVTRFEDNETWRRIVSSVRSEGMGGYGDFGRYVMDAKVHYFSDIRLTEPPPDDRYRGHFPGTTARRWILQRVEELGWTGERFAEHERHAPYGRQSHDIEELKLERISKKYQWIALRELQGFLADNYWLSPSSQDGTDLQFAGAWQLWTREFDPSQRLIDLDHEEVIKSNNESIWQREYPNPFQDANLCENRETWVIRSPDDFAVLLSPQSGIPDHNKKWLVLAGHHEWVEPEYDRVVSGRRGTLKMWVNIRSFLVRKGDRAHFIARACETNFYGHGCEFPEQHTGWIGEYPWGAAYWELTEWCESPDERVGKVGVPYTITTCHWSKGSTLIPSPQLCDLLDLEWAGEGGAFKTIDGEAIVRQLGGDAEDWGRPLLVRQDSLNAALEAAGLELVWCALAERSCWCSETSTHIVKKELEVSAVYWLEKDAIKGGVTQTIAQPLGGPRR